MRAARPTRTKDTIECILVLGPGDSPSGWVVRSGCTRPSELRWSMTRLSLLIATFAQGVAVVLVALSGVWSTAGGADGPVVDPDVRAAIGAGPVRVLVDLRVSSSDPSAIASLQDEALRRLAGTGTRLARRYASAPMLALEIDAPALTRLEAMRDIVVRVRADRVTPLNGEHAPRR